jgi:hypothetical protein
MILHDFALSSASYRVRIAQRCIKRPKRRSSLAMPRE